MDSFARINPKLVDVHSPEVGPHDGYPDELKAMDTIDALKDACGETASDFPQALWIEPSNWADKARDNDKYHRWPINYVDRFTNQNPTHECTCHALTRVAEGCRNRQRGIIFPDGPKAGHRYAESARGSVWLSPLSIYSEANPRQWGGAGCTQVLNIAARRGFLPEKIQPYDYDLKHQIQGTTGKGNNNQSSGPWLRVSDFPQGWEETAKHFMPKEYYFTESFEQVVCLILHGYLVEVGRSGHAIPYAFWNVADRVMGYIDSYDVIRYDSERTVKGCSNGAFTIASMPIPQDYLKPTALAA